MTVHAVRDWRGIKFKVSEYSTEDLIDLLTNAEHTHEQVAWFLDEVAAELRARGDLSTNLISV
jgi:hypothetical protein